MTTNHLSIKTPQKAPPPGISPDGGAVYFSESNNTYNIHEENKDLFSDNNSYSSFLTENPSDRKNLVNNKNNIDNSSSNNNTKKKSRR